MFCLKNQSAWICVEAGPSIGARPVHRCLAIACSLKKYGIQSTFYASPLPRLLGKRIAELGFELVELTSDFKTWCSTVDSCHRSNPWIVFDSVDGLETWSSDSATVLSMQTSESSSKQLVVDLSCRERSSLFQDVLQGPDYFVVESDQVPTRSLNSRTRRMLIQARHAATIERLLNTIVKMGWCDLSLDINVQNLWQPSEKLRQDLGNLNCQIRIQRNIDRFRSLFDLSDLSIFEDWDSYWFAVSQGYPALFFDSLDAGPAVQGLRNVGCSSLVELNEDVDDLAIRLSQLLKSRDKRRSLVDNSRFLIDGQGADRIARALMASSFRIRPCSNSDSATLHSWRNDPELRVVSFQQEQIPYQRHQAWLEQRLNSAGTEIYIIEDRAGRPAGQFRLEYDDERNSVRLHVSLIPSLRGFGLGTAFIERAVRFVQGRDSEVEVYAFIKSVNQVSQAAFRKAGFVPVATMTKNGQVALKFCRGPMFTPAPNVSRRRAA